MGPNQSNRPSRRESGQAGVESALILPISLFLILGTLQLALMTHARIMTEYAAYRATRAGSVNHGNCTSMNHAALAALLPSFRRSDSPAKLGEAFEAVRDNRYGAGYTLSNGTDIGNEPVVWIYRERPLSNEIAGVEDSEFDYRSRNSQPMQLQVTMVYWYPMRIPFADWVLFRMSMAQMGLESYTAANPLMEAQPNAGWETESAPGAHLTSLNEVYSRMQSNLSAKRYVFPIRASHTMRMMTPAKRRHFQQQNCFSA